VTHAVDAPARVEARPEPPVVRSVSLPELLLRRAEGSPDGVALRAKDRGIYREVRWREYQHEVERVAAGLRMLGFAAGDRLAILGDPCPEWLYCEMGALAAGGVCYGIYPTSSATQIAQLLDHGGAQIVVVENQEQLDKLLDCGAALERVRHIIIIDTRGVFGYTDPRLTSYRELIDVVPERVVPLADMVRSVDGAGPALMIFTSGTGGEPRAAVYTHAGIAQGAEDYRVCLLGDRKGVFRTVCHLPLNHAFEQWNTVLLPLMAEVVPHFGEDAARFAETLFDVAPDYYASVPRHWQKLASRMLVGIENTSPEKRALYRLAMKVGRTYVRAHWEGRPSPALSLAYKVAYLGVFRPILDKLGMKRVRVAMTAGGAIPVEVQTLWQIWGINLRNLYGQTEAGFISVQMGEYPPPGDVGQLAPSVKVRIGEDGEILIQSTARFQGYLGEPAIGPDDWFPTGDVGTLDEAGVLKIVDRKKDLFITAGGKNVSPLAIENLMKSSPYISEVIVVGDGRSYLSALVEIDPDPVAQWARSRGITYGSFEELATHARVAELIEGEVQRLNQQLARVEQIKVVRIIPRELDPEAEGEPVTPTRKVKRKLMYQRFKDLVESMYQDTEEQRITSEVDPGRSKQ
jgi:long-chain acyl-CoA synthetase